jgi:pilus assembly protein CpaE
MEVAKESYEVIVVDTSPFFHGPMLATLDQTDDLLLVCGLEVPTIKNVRLSLQTLQLRSFPTERVRAVLNRANSNVGMKRRGRGRPSRIRRSAERPRCPARVNRSNPAVLSDPSRTSPRGARGGTRRHGIRDGSAWERTVAQWACTTASRAARRRRRHP